MILDNAGGFEISIKTFVTPRCASHSSGSKSIAQWE
jgi:hypothetical protein